MKMYLRDRKPKWYEVIGSIVLGVVAFILFF